MQRRFVPLIAAVALLAVPAFAPAAVTITVGSHVFTPGNPVANVEILMHATEGEALNSADINVLLNNLLGGGPMATAWVMNGAGTIFNEPSQLDPFFSPPSDTELFQSVYLDSTTTNVPIGANGVLAVVTFDATGVPLGDYPWTLDDNIASGGGTFGSVFFATTGEVVPVSITPGLLQVVPEPGSVVLALFAAAGLGAVIIRRRRSA